MKPDVSILHMLTVMANSMGLHAQLHKRAQQYTATVKAKSGVESTPATATAKDCGDLYFVSPEGEFLASYGPDAAPKAIAAEWSETMKVISHLNATTKLALALSCWNTWVQKGWMRFSSLPVSLA